MSVPPIRIRPERPADAPAIARIHDAAFTPSTIESAIVARLRERSELMISLVAERRDNNQAPGECNILGHIAVSPVTIDGVDNSAIRAAGVGPIGVLPDCQRRGVGTSLMRAAIELAKETADCGLLVVLGDPAYYRRFGFVRASDYEIGNEYGADDAFQVLELAPGALSSVAGTVRYSAAFA